MAKPDSRSAIGDTIMLLVILKVTLVILYILTFISYIYDTYDLHVIVQYIPYAYISVHPSWIFT